MKHWSCGFSPLSAFVHLAFLFQLIIFPIIYFTLLVLSSVARAYVHVSNKYIQLRTSLCHYLLISVYVYGMFVLVAPVIVLPAFIYGS